MKTKLIAIPLSSFLVACSIACFSQATTKPESASNSKIVLDEHFMAINKRWRGGKFDASQNASGEGGGSLRVTSRAKNIGCSIILTDELGKSGPGKYRLTAMVKLDGAEENLKIQLGIKLTEKNWMYPGNVILIEKVGTWTVIKAELKVPYFDEATPLEEVWFAIVSIDDEPTGGGLWVDDVKVELLQ